MPNYLEINILTSPEANVTEAAIIGVPDELTGQAINAIVSLKTTENLDDIQFQLITKVRTAIGPFAAPKKVLVVDDIPKTRSGKIVRRILRRALSGETEFGDTSTVRNNCINAI